MRYGISGVKVHDARLIASMNVYGMNHLRTFIADDFRRYQGMTVIEPQHIPLAMLLLFPQATLERFGQHERQEFIFSRAAVSAKPSLGLVRSWFMFSGNGK